MSLLSWKQLVLTETTTVEATTGPLFLVGLLDNPLVLVAYDSASRLECNLHTINHQTRILSKGVEEIRLTPL